MSNAGSRVRRQLPPHPSSAGEARRLVRRLLVDAGRDDLLEPAQLLVSEIVTNALVHGGTSIDVSMAIASNGVLVEVCDGSKHVPMPRNYGLTANTGRGLTLLEETADAWGVVPGVAGKTVWFRITSGEDDAAVEAAVPEAPARPTPRRSPDQAVVVQLLNMPLLLHLAWQQHASAVLREYLLASMGLDLDEGPLAVHAEATDALALLEEHVPLPEVDIEPHRVMVAGLDTVLSHPRVEVSVPVASVPNFAVLSDVLDTGLEMAARGQLLVPPTQPELDEMRQWMCDQVRLQAEGAAPTPWALPDELELDVRRGPAEAEPIETNTATAVIAADDVGLIIGVGDGALDLLGYRRNELVGQRLVTIIPPRYRQAHLAGLTLHLIAGRGPILGHSVAVPALRRDGVEIPIEMRIEAHPGSNGNRVFVATVQGRTGAVRSAG